jgi:hypothetical protein
VVGVSEQWYHTDEENDEVATSPSLWRPLRRHFHGFDLDPAAGAEPTPIAEERYTERGLQRPWYGTVWLNPPFSDKGPWFERLVNHIERDLVDAAVAVSSPPTSSAWFQDCFSTADQLVFLSERDVYLFNGDNPSFSTVLAFWNPPAAATEWAQTQGVVVEPVSDDTQARLSEVSGDE